MLEHGGFLVHGREEKVCGSGPLEQALMSKAQDPQRCGFKPPKSQNYSNSQCCLDPIAITK